MKTPTSGASLRELQEHLEHFGKEKGWHKRTNLESFLLFSEEVGELAKAIRYETRLKSETLPANHSLEMEFADVLNYLMDLANRFDIDLTKAYLAKHKVNSSRTWK